MEKKRQLGLADGREADGMVVGAKSYDSEKAWSSINHSILSGQCSTQLRICSFPGRE
jgi:hypothetical protein